VGTRDIRRAVNGRAQRSVDIRGGVAIVPFRDAEQSLSSGEEVEVSGVVVVEPVGD